MSTRINRIPHANRTRARGMFALLRVSGVSMRRAYVAAVAVYGRPMLRGFYWDQLPAHTRRLVAGLAMS